MLFIIVDRCTGCSTGGLSLSQNAWSDLTGIGANRVQVNWDFVACWLIIDGVTPKVSITDHSDEWWFAFQPTNTALSIKYFKIKGNGGDWILLTRNQNLWIGAVDYGISTPVTIEMGDTVGSIYGLNLTDISSSAGQTLEMISLN